MEKLQNDYSTIDMDALKKLPVAKLAPAYRLQDGMGNGCAGDAPGFPTYFTKSVYTSHGNTPNEGAEMVLLGHVVASSTDWDKAKTWDDVHALRQARLLKLYKPLPVDHPRVQEWINSRFTHFKNCYRDPSNPKETVIYPVPYYKLKTFTDDSRFNDEWRTAAKAEVEAWNKDVEAQTKAIATVDNHLAVIYIREIYPDFMPTEDQMAGNVPRSYNWFERLPRRPEPDECPGEAWGRDGRHPVNKTWCQVCGWTKNEEANND